MSALADTLRMELDDAWKTRLADAVEKSGRSMRAISLAADAGPGYLHSVLQEGKDPSVGKLLAVCRALGASPTFILYGIDVLPEDAEVIDAMRADPETRDAVVSLLRRRTGP